MKDFDKIFNQIDKKYHNLTQFFSHITNSDMELFNSFLKKTYQSPESLKNNFENSFEYIRMYFNSGRYQGFKFYDKENLIIFALEKKTKPHFKLFKPLGPGPGDKVAKIIKALSEITYYPIHTVCLDNKLLNVLKEEKGIEIKNIKEFNYYIYDLNTMVGLRGNRWKNVRQKINAFKKNHPMTKFKIESLSEENCKDIVHFIGAWRRDLITKRGFSFANLEKNKFAAMYYADKNNFKDIWAMAYRLKNRVIAFQLLYRLGADSAAHAIGLADPECTGLNEFSQIHIWEQLQKAGIRFINDGPSWRPGLERYKHKFNPITVQKVFECKIRSRENK